MSPTCGNQFSGEVNTGPAMAETARTTSGSCTSFLSGMPWKVGIGILVRASFGVVLFEFSFKGVSFVVARSARQRG